MVDADLSAPAPDVPRPVVIGTAGHVDHGKTWLVRALTGVDTDRLEEEKRRGMTIDLGFAPLALPDGRQASIVDVPGHEHLVRTMICGAAGIDLVLLVVAADEGFMPQTQEHLDILQTLGLARGIIVLTKLDLVESDWLQVVEEDVRDRVRGTFLEEAPLVGVSAATGQGLDRLRDLIGKALEACPAPRSDLPLRLPVDRAFVVRGFGTVVTGSLQDGAVGVGDMVEVQPQGLEAKVRGLQTNGDDRQEAQAGCRLALNLAGVSLDQVGRGSTLVAPGSADLARQVAVWLDLVADAPYDVRTSSRLHVFLGTQELVGRVRLLDREVLRAGEGCPAQLTFDRDLCLRPQDRFVARFFSPVVTVGGGRVLMATSRKLRRNDPVTLARLEALAGPVPGRVRQVLADAGALGLTVGEVARRSGLGRAEADRQLGGMVREGKAVALGPGTGGAGACQENRPADTRPTYVEAGCLRDLSATARDLLVAFHRGQPLEAGMDLDTFRQALARAAGQTAVPGGPAHGHVTGRDPSVALESEATRPLLAWLVAEGTLEVVGSRVRLPGFEPHLTADQARMADLLRALYGKAGLEPPLNEEVLAKFGESSTMARGVLSYLVRTGDLVALSPDLTVDGDAYGLARATLKDMLDTAGSLTLADYRTRLGVSRRVARYYLDHFDACGLTRLVGDVRVLVGAL